MYHKTDMLFLKDNLKYLFGISFKAKYTIITFIRDFH